MRYSLITIFILTNNWFLWSQSDSLLIQNRVDSLMKLDYLNYSYEEYLEYQNIRRRSKKTGYYKGVLQSHIQLIWYYTKHKNIDSLFYHGKQFEKYIDNHPNEKLEKVYYSSISRSLLYHYYLPDFALDYYLKLHKLEKDKRLQAIWTTILIDCYLLKHQYKNAIEEGEALLKQNIFNKKKNHLAYIGLQSKMLLAHQRLGNIKKSSILTEEIERDTTIANVKEYLVYIKLYKPYNYYLEGQYQKSIDSLHLHSDLIVSQGTQASSTYHKFIALSYAQMKDYPKAIKAIRKSINQASFNELPELYDTVTEYYKVIAHKDSALFFLQKKSKIIDSIRQIEERIYMDYFHTKKENIDVNFTNEQIIRINQNLITANNKKIWYIILIGIFLIIVLLILGILNRKYLFSKQTIINAYRENDRLQTNIVIKNYKITSTLVHRERGLEQLKNIKQKIDKNMTLKQDYKIHEGLKRLDNFILRGGEIKPSIDELLYQNQELVAALREKSKKLSKTDIVHCILVYHGISIKDSAALLYINDNTVRNSRYRAKSKLSLEKEEKLKQYLTELYNSWNYKMKSKNGYSIKN